MPSTSVLKGVVTVPDDPNIDFEVDRNTLPLPLLQELTPPIHMIELLSGACGGWKVATQSKARNTGIEFRTLAMDLELRCRPSVCNWFWSAPSEWKDLD
jgi:hypothetical protein